MSAGLVRLFQFGQPAVKRHALFAKVTSVFESKNQGALMCLPAVLVQASELVANLDLVRPRTRGSEAILEKNRRDHHGQQDHDYVGRYLDFGLHHRYLRALSKAESSLNSGTISVRQLQSGDCGPRLRIEIESSFQPETNWLDSLPAPEREALYCSEP